MHRSFIFPEEISQLFISVVYVTVLCVNCEVYVSLKKGNHVVIRIESVSYTHLDVYKRQELR